MPVPITLRATLLLFVWVPVALAATEESVPEAIDPTLTIETRIDALLARVTDRTSPGEGEPALIDQPVNPAERLLVRQLLHEIWGPGRFDAPADRIGRLDQLRRRWQQLPAPTAKPPGTVELSLMQPAGPGRQARATLDLQVNSTLDEGARLILPADSWLGRAVRVRGRVIMPPEPGDARGVNPEVSGAVPDADAIGPDAPRVDAREDDVRGEVGLGGFTPAPAPRLQAARTHLGWEFTLTGAPVALGTPIQLTALATAPRAARAAAVVWLRPVSGQPAVPITSNTVALRVPPERSVTIDAPTLLAAGSPAVARIEVLDGAGRALPRDQWPALDVLVNGAFRERLTGAAEIDLVFADPGVYRLELRSGGGGTRGESNPIVVRRHAPARLRWQVPLTPLAEQGGSSTASDAARFAYQVDERPLRRGGAAAFVLTGPAGFETQAESAITQIALPVPAFDVRRFRAGSPAFVQPLMGGGGHLWYVARAARTGHRFALYQVQALDGPGETATAEWLTGDRRPFGPDASTYVTTGGRPFVDVRVNGAGPGARSSFRANAQVTADIVAHAPVSVVEVVKNGEVVHVFRPSAPEGYAAEAPPRISLRFEAPSTPWLDQRDWPRNGREWIGFVRVTGASITSVRADGEGTPRRASALDETASRVDFITWSRGLPTYIDLTLDGADAGLALEIALREGLEDEQAPTRYREPSAVPGARFLFEFDELQAGVRRVLRTAGYGDIVEARLEVGTPPREVQMSWTDPSRARAGDFYWLQARFADGSRVWTSPVWNGGFDVAN